MLWLVRNTATNEFALEVPMFRRDNLTVTVSLESTPPDAGKKLSESRTLPAPEITTGPTPTGTVRAAESLAAPRSTGFAALTWAELVSRPSAFGLTVAVNVALAPLVKGPTFQST